MYTTKTFNFSTAKTPTKLITLKGETLYRNETQSSKVVFVLVVLMMGKGRTRAVETGQSLSVSSNGLLNIPPGPVYYPTEEEFRDPLEYIYKIRPDAEPYGICKIVPPKNWNPPFALDLNSFTFPTKTQAIHQLQARPASCDSKTFELEYNRFLEGNCGKKLKKRVAFEGEELDLCKLFNAVRRFGGYDKVVKDKNWGEVFRFVRSGWKISECAKHVLSQLYREHLYDYECYHNRLNQQRAKGSKRGIHGGDRSEKEIKLLNSKRRRKNENPEKVKGCKAQQKEVEEPDQICEQCNSGLHEEVMLLCDRCNKGWHIYCLSPPLKQVPPGNWYCFECLNSDKESFGFVPGKQFELAAFRHIADRAKRKWFGSASASRTQIEKKFWEIVEGSAGEVEVMYGSDLDTSIYGSGFPRPNDRRPESVDIKLWDEYCSSPWNLNNLPKLKGSVLRAVNHNITGVMVPWLYVGMLFSAFCWHFEDHCFYSMNYMHWGEPKCWYSVPGNKAGAFEKVMRHCLPDLFDAQPDLLFQLVTMLNPSILCENSVPVYSVLQEPGNFVVTFPRSYHGGFNLGLNCAEAVNFAPADWLPHGGFGAGLYQLYHKSAVLSHEELLCAVAKLNDWDSKAVPHLKKELERIYIKEKTWRERLWRSGVVRSSPIPKCPEYAGTEEDPTCVICKQYLYLSAVVCRCRPSASVCLEHHEHLCECQYRKRRILYRYSLAELSDLVLRVDVDGSEVTPQNGGLRRQIISKESHPLAKKVKGSNVPFSQLAEEWLLHACKVLQSPFSAEAYATSIKEAEQFLWAGSDMDPLRDMVKTLTKVQEWAKGVRHCLSKIEKLTGHPGSKIEKVLLEDVTKLLSIDPVPCNEAGHLKLKGYVKEAVKLVQEIDAALSTCSKIEELETLYSRVCRVPVHVKQSEKLQQKISSAKDWKESAKKYVLDRLPKPVEVSILYKLKSEIMELQVQVPEKELVLDMARQAELCQTRCMSILNDAVRMKDVEVLLEEMDDFAVSIPELTLLKQYKVDVSLWYSRLNKVLLNVHQREDQHNIINELNSILKDGASLRIQVEELPLVEIELKKAFCREKALKARDTKLSLESIQHLVMEASVLQIEKEKLFVDLSGAVEAAIHWEEQAKDILENKGQMSEFEDLIRISDGIGAILPSLDEVKKSVSIAKSWLKDSEPFLKPDTFAAFASHSSLKLEALKELVSQSVSLKILLEEVHMLEVVLTHCNEWVCNAWSLLHDVECLYDIADVGDGRSNNLISKIELLVTSVESITEAGFSFHVDLEEISKLQNACSMLRWCNKVLSFCYSVPSCKDVQSLIEIGAQLAITCSSGPLLSSLIKGANWLNEASDVISTPLNGKRCTLRNAEEILAQYQVINVAFPLMVEQLSDAVQKHRVWQEQVNRTFSLTSGERTWSEIVQLKEHGETVAFSCAELNMILSEVEKVEHWKQCCCNVVGTVAENANSLLAGLQKIKESVDRSFCIYGNSRCSEGINQCIHCTSHSEDNELLSCSTCQDCYHLLCLRSILVGINCAQVDMCLYCQFCFGLHPLGGPSPLGLVGKRPNIRMLEKLLSDSDLLCVRIEERDILQKILDKAFASKMRLKKIVDFERSYIDENTDIVSKQLSTALKALEVVGIDDHESYHDLKQALARNSWRARVRRLLEGLGKPTMQQIQQHLKEGVVMNIRQEDYFRQRLTVLKEMGIQWAGQARKVAADFGSLPLREVFELIAEGENLPVLLEKELESLRARSMLHCICRKPYDERSMIACQRCSEWYHMKCVKLLFPPKFYICAACEPLIEDLGSLLMPMDHDCSRSAKSVEPKTPSPQHSKSRKKPKKPESSLAQKLLVSDDTNLASCSSGIDNLWWRTRKPFRRAARKRTRFDFSSLFFS